MLTLFKLGYVFVILVLLYICFKLLFIGGEGGPSFLAQAWRESPICTLMSIPILLIVGILIFKEE